VVPRLLLMNGLAPQGSRHPCLEAMGQVHFIPNDVNLTRGTLSHPWLSHSQDWLLLLWLAHHYSRRTDKSLVNIITGPNMGGKST